MAGPFALLRRTGLTALVAAWLTIVGWTLDARGQERFPTPARMQVADQLAEPGAGSSDPLAGNAYAGPARFAETGSPPIEYWQPTWMPCQSLRTNRSLVLGHLYFGFELMGWKTKGAHAPALVASDGAPAFGNEYFHDDVRPGGKLTIGWWFDPNQYSGVEFHYFELDGEDLRFDATSGTGGPTLTRPIINAGTGLSDSVLISNGGSQTGSISVNSNLQLSSTGILYRSLIWSNEVARVDYSVGYRHTHLFDNLRTDETISVNQATGSFLAGDAVTRRDTFRAITQFDGLDLGIRGWWSNNGTLAFTCLTNLAVGASNRTALVDGLTSIRNGNTTITYDGRGVLGLPSNVGLYSEQDMGLVAEVGLGLEWQPICFWKFSLGYTWFFWSNVARAVHQIDTTISTTQLARTAGVGTSPETHLNTSSFWAQGLTAGFQYQF